MNPNLGREYVTGEYLLLGNIFLVLKEIGNRPMLHVCVCVWRRYLKKIMSLNLPFCYQASHTEYP